MTSLALSEKTKEICKKIIDLSHELEKNIDEIKTDAIQKELIEKIKVLQKKENIILKIQNDAQSTTTQSTTTQSTITQPSNILSTDIKSNRMPAGSRTRQWDNSIISWKNSLRNPFYF